MSRALNRSMKFEAGENSRRHQRLPRRVLTVQESVAMFLMRFAAGLDFGLLSVFFAVAPSTVAYMFPCVLFSMVETHKGQIAWPDETERQRLKDLAVEKHGPLCTGKTDSCFFNTNFLGLVGLVDGTEFFIHRPTINQGPYYGRKMRHSIKAQAIVSIEKKFLHVVVGRYGSTHDAPMLLESDIWREHSRFLGAGEFLFGDVAYPQTPFLFTPYRTHEILRNQERIDFNIKFSAVRIAVEHAFGMLKESWIFVGKPIMANQQYYNTIIHCAFILHNLKQNL
jgi:hypothetical protein